jgi:hypothetical protein
MTSVRRASLSTCLPLVGALAGLAAAEVPLPAPGGRPQIEAPNLEFDAGGAVVAPRGFVAHFSDKLLIGDALRYHQKHDDLYATGRVVLVFPGVRLHATRLGLHPQAEIGEAWDVEAFVEHAGRRITITAERVYLDRTVLRFDGVTAIAGHGGLVAVGARSARVYLREQPAKDRRGFERQVSGIEVVSPTVRIADWPVFWLPWLYRDFVYDYPWTRYEGGKTRRLGYYVRGWLGSSLPEVFGWHPRVEVRGDLYSRTGEGWGATASWVNPGMGKGSVTWFDVPHEVVMGGPDDLQNVAVRHASVFDAEQRLHGLGGAFYGRLVDLPDADPPYAGDPAAPWTDRFRADYLRDDLEHRPLARRGATATWGTGLGTITLDSERRAHPDQPTTDRLWGVQVHLPRLRVAGMLHLGGTAWSEHLENTSTDDAAVRTSFSGSASAMQWYGPLGVDAGGGANGLAYHQGRLAGTDLPDDERRVVPFAVAGLRTRFVGEWGDGLTHVFTPRVGVALFGEGDGDTLSAWRFGDPRDTLDEDLHLLTAGFDTSIAATRSLFRATAVARWGLRPQDREFTDALGNPTTAPSPLVDVLGSLEGSPIATVVLTGTFAYDAQRETWRSFDVASSWAASTWLALRYNGTLIPETTTSGNQWQHRPGLTLFANRYRLDGDMTFRPGGDPLDQWLAQLTRRMVDGDLTLTYELLRDDDGVIYDRRFGVGFTLSLGGAPGTAAPAGETTR